MWHSLASGRGADIERVMTDLERRLAGLNRMVRASRGAAPAAVDSMGDTIAAALGDIAERFRGRTRAASKDAHELSDEALKLGNDALRKLTREVEQRPLLLLAVAFGVGAIAAGLFARRG